MAEPKREREREEEFYEAMPGTMDSPAVGRDVDYIEDDEDWAREDYERNSILPWVLVAVVIVLLGLLLLGGLSLNRNTTGTTGDQQNQSLPK
jgi:hypothetical protein